MATEAPFALPPQDLALRPPLFSFLPDQYPPFVVPALVYWVFGRCRPFASLCADSV